MTRQIKRMSYQDAARELCEVLDLRDNARRELDRAERNVDQAMLNMFDALSRKGTGPPRKKAT